MTAILKWFGVEGVSGVRGWNGLVKCKLLLWLLFGPCLVTLGNGSVRCMFCCGG